MVFVRGAEVRTTKNRRHVLRVDAVGVVSGVPCYTQGISNPNRGRNGRLLIERAPHGRYDDLSARRLEWFCHHPPSSSTPAYPGRTGFADTQAGLVLSRLSVRSSQRPGPSYRLPY